MIQLQIENEADLYNPYDPSRTRINEGVYHYLKSYCSPLEASKHVHDTLQIITDSPTINHDIKNLKKLLEPIKDIRLEVIQRNSA